MATFSANNLYIVVTFSSYDGVRGDTDTLYTDKAEAEQAAKEENECWQKNNSSLKSDVMTLDDYIMEVKQNEYNRGQVDEARFNRD